MLLWSNEVTLPQPSIHYSCTMHCERQPRDYGGWMGTGSNNFVQLLKVNCYFWQLLLASSSMWCQMHNRTFYSSSHVLSTRIYRDDAILCSHKNVHRSINLSTCIEIYMYVWVCTIDSSGWTRCTVKYNMSEPLWSTESNVLSPLTHTHYSWNLQTAKYTQTNLNTLDSHTNTPKTLTLVFSLPPFTQFSLLPPSSSPSNQKGHLPTSVCTSPPFLSNIRALLEQNRTSGFPLGLPWLRQRALLSGPKHLWPQSRSCTFTNRWILLHCLIARPNPSHFRRVECWNVRDPTPSQKMNIWRSNYGKSR